MNTQPFAGARYSTHHMGMAFELAEEGEVYMICQGSGGGYGDVLERDPDAVMRDVESGYLSGDTAREIYFVVYDPDTLAVDLAATEAARAAERQARLQRGRSYQEFVSEWVTPEPPEHLSYYGSWGGNNGIIRATAWTMQGPVRVAGPMSELPQIFLPDPNVLALAVQQARIADLEARLQEIAVAVQQARIADLARLQERETL
jgi:acetone carboxylase, alpha subunit